MRRVEPTHASWLWRLLVCITLAHTGLGLARPVLTYRVLDFEGTAVDIGVLTAAHAAVPVLVALWLGRRIDRLRRVELVVASGAVGLASACIGAALAPGVPGLVLASAGLGTANLALLVAAQASVAHRSGPGTLDRDFGWFSACSALGQGLGPAIGGWVLTVAGESPGHGAAPALVLAAVICVGAAVPMVRFPAASSAGLHGSGPDDPARPGSVPLGRAATRPAEVEDAEPGSTEPEPAVVGPPGLVALLGRPGIRSALVVSTLLLCAVDLLTAYLPLLAEQRGIGPAAVGMLLAVRGFSSMASRFLLGTLSRRASRERLVTVSALGAGLCLGLTGVVPSVVMLAGLMVVGGFLLGIGQPLTMALVVSIAPASMRASALALRLVGNRTGQLAIPLLAGGAASRWGVGALFIGQAVLMVASGAWNGARPRAVAGPHD